MYNRLLQYGPVFVYFNHRNNGISVNVGSGTFCHLPGNGESASAYASGHYDVSDDAFNSILHVQLFLCTPVYLYCSCAENGRLRTVANSDSTLTLATFFLLIKLISSEMSLDCQIKQFRRLCSYGRLINNIRYTDVFVDLMKGLPSVSGTQTAGAEFYLARLCLLGQ